MRAGIRILIVDDEPATVEVCAHALRSIEAAEIVVQASGRDALARIGDGGVDLLITDLRMPDLNGLELMKLAHERDADLPVVILTGFPSVETAVEGLKAGARDYLTKPFHPEELLRTVEQVLDHRRPGREERALSEQGGEEGAIDGLLGKSAAMQEVFKAIRLIAPKEVDVLLVGETGTGKELVARAIQRGSIRCNAPFLALDCGAIPPELVESEFFGHERGAFTGAHTLVKGLFERAQGGILFLDEIDHLTPFIQAKLLRVIQERVIRRVGGHGEIPLDIRILTASSADLQAKVRSGHFREDLYYRINVARINLPPLRERSGDVPLLAEHFCARIARVMLFSRVRL
jgi:DNA-binding NtrC family response regulator